MRQAIPSRRRGSGTARTGGPFLLDEANPTTDLFRVIATIDGTVGPVSRFYLSQDRAFLLGDPLSSAGGTVVKMPNGGYTNNCVNLYLAQGKTGVSSFPNLAHPPGGATPISWTDGDTGTGIFMVAMRAYGGSEQSFPTNYPRGKPQVNIVAPMGVAFDWRDNTQSRTDPTTWKNTANPIVGLVHELWNFRGYDWALDFEPALDILTAEANVCDAPTPYLNVFSQTRIYSNEGEDFVVLDPDGPIPPDGTTLFVGGQALTVTSNAGAFTRLNYTGTKIVLSGTLLAGVPPQFPVRWQMGPGTPVTEPTYACGGVWNADEPEKDTVKKFLDAMDGWMQRRGLDGAVIIRCGHFIAPTVTIGPDEIISYTWDEYASSGKVINELLPAFVAAAWDYTQVDTTIVDRTDDQLVNGISNQAFKPDFVQSNGQVLRLANRRADQLLSPVQSLTLKRSGLRATGERFINVNFGADLPAVTVEVCGRATIKNNGMQVVLPVRQVDPATIDAYDCYTQEGSGPAASAPAITGNLGLSPPTVDGAVTYTAPIGSGASTPTGEFLQVTVAPPAAQATRTDLTWQVQWQVSGDTSWSPPQTFTDQPAGTITLDKIGPVPTGSTLVVQAAFFTGGGQFSGWSASFTVASGLLTPGGLDIDTPGGLQLEKPS